MVEGAALEMLCPERDLGFESLTLRHYNSNPNAPRFIFVNGLFGIICKR